MELRQLEYFVAVAEEANFTRAARRVNISQSGVSAQLRQLERELGTEVIDRSTRTATLTPAGSAAIGHAKAAIAAAAAVRQSVDDVTGLIRGRIAVGMVTACSVTPLFDALATFHLAHPSIEINLTEDNSSHMIRHVRSGAIDLALVGCMDQPPTDLQSLLVASEGLVAAVPPGHAIAELQTCTLAQVVSHPLVCLPPGTGIRTVLDSACATQGLTPTVALQASAPDSVIDLARRGLGVGILSESMTAGNHGPLTRVPISGVNAAAVLALIWRSTSNPAVNELVHHCGTAFDEPPPRTRP